MFRKRHPKVGARPGTLAINSHSPPPVIRVMTYRPEGVDETQLADVNELGDVLKRDGVSWIDVQGFGDETVIRTIGALFRLHPLALEDLVNVPQRPKAEVYDEHLLLITQMTMLAKEGGAQTEQVGLVLGQRFLLTVQERYGDVLDPVRERLRWGKGPMRSSGADYLAYAIVDALIDGYYPVLESLDARLEDVEERLTESPSASVLREIHNIKRELLMMRRAVWPQRDMVNTVIRDECAQVTDNVRVYLRDCYDHVVQVMDVVESYRELAGGLMDVYLSSVSNRQNEVMKVLTIMASIFIPLTFLAGIYGMNFENMPELHRPWAYPILLAVMAIVGLTMLYLFWRKGWLGSYARWYERDDGPDN